MIPNIDDFVSVFKGIVDNHINIYSNEATFLRKWSNKDFVVSDIVNEMDKTNSILLYSVYKKAYDTIRAYHRTYTIYLKSRGDYFRAGETERNKDKLILDTIVNNLNNVCSTLKNTMGVK